MARQRGAAVKSITVMAGAGPDDWAGVVEAPGSAGFSRAMIELAGPVMHLHRPGGTAGHWDADRLKALRAVEGNSAVLHEAVRVAGDEIDSVRHRIEKLAAALRSYVEETGDRPPRLLQTRHRPPPGQVPSGCER